MKNTQQYRLLAVTLGLIFVFFGLLAIPLPLPLGLPLMVIGGGLLLANSRKARKAYVRFRRRCRKFPRIHGFLILFERRLLRKKAT